jgi:hypothetical protein
LPSSDQPRTPRDRDELLDDVYGRARRLWYQRRVLPVGAAIVALAALLTAPVLLRDSDGGRQIAATDEPTTVVDETTTTEAAFIEETTTTLDTAATALPVPTTTRPRGSTTTTPSSHQGPPDGTLESADGKVDGQQGSYCWRTQNADGTSTGLCADTAEPEPRDVLTVRRGEQLTLRYGTNGQPREVHGWIQRSDAGEEFAVPDANPARFQVDCPPGTYTIWFSSLWAEGDGSHWFRVTVRE